MLSLEFRDINGVFNTFTHVHLGFHGISLHLIHCFCTLMYCIVCMKINFLLARVALVIFLSVPATEVMAQQFTEFSPSAELPDLNIADMIRDEKNQIWIATWKGYARYNGSEWKHFDVPGAGSSQGKMMCNGIAVKNDTVWIGCMTGGIHCIFPDGSSISYKTGTIPSELIYDLTMDKQGNVWASFAANSMDIVPGYGVGKFNGTFWTIYNVDNSDIGLTDIWSIKCDSLNNIWFQGVKDPFSYTELVRFDGEEFFKYNRQNSFPIDTVTNIDADPSSGKVFVTYDKGIVEITEKGEYRTITNPVLEDMRFNKGYYDYQSHFYIPFRDSSPNENPWVVKVNIEDFSLDTIDPATHEIFTYAVGRIFFHEDSDEIWYTSGYDLLVRQTGEVGYNELFAKNSKLYPNPASDVLNVDFGNSDIHTLRIFSMDGKELLMLIGQQASTIDVSRLTPGTYLISILSESGISNHKLFINR